MRLCCGLKPYLKPIVIVGRSCDFSRCSSFYRVKSCWAHRLSGRNYKAELPYIDTHKLRRKQITPPPAPVLGRRVITGRLGCCIPTPKTTINGTHLITPYTSRPTVRPDPVRRIYEGRPSGTLCKLKQRNWTTVHKVTDT